MVKSENHNSDNNILGELINQTTGEYDELENISFESAAENKKSYFRIYEGLRLTEPNVKELIENHDSDMKRKKPKSVN